VRPGDAGGAAQDGVGDAGLCRGPDRPGLCRPVRGRVLRRPGAQGEFLRGASRSPGGKPIICLPSTSADGNESRIRDQLRPGEGVTVARTDVHYVITEFGIAYLFGKSIRERAVALIEIANPRFAPNCS
jgi:acyl-CoA hydrolase